ncbi:MAG TPA: nuclear transport factor 2 family protein [Steroidobacteraceae bacterium]|nr:nuclear transport factor 2 family protein [Steroidobacteraceae bacterium]
MNMNSVTISACLVLLGAAAPAMAEGGSPGAASGESQVRALEQQQVRAALAGDAATLRRIFTDDYRMVNPAGQITTREQLLAMLTGATRPYRSATYTTDVVRDLGQVIVTIGREDVVPNQGPQAGQVVHRRVTQVWVSEQGAWRLSVRHAMVVPNE